MGALHLSPAPLGGWCSGGGRCRSTTCRFCALVRCGEIWERGQQRLMPSAVEVGTVIRNAIACDPTIGQHKQGGVDHIVLEHAAARERGRAVEYGESGRIAAGLSRIDAHDVREESRHELTDSSRAIPKRPERANHLSEDRSEDCCTGLLSSQRPGL